MLSASGCSGSRRRTIVAGAVVGSLAVDRADRFSDLDLTFGIADHVRVADVLDDWTRTLIDELDAVHLAELERGPTTYRVFLLPDALQFDLSMTPGGSLPCGRAAIPARVRRDDRGRVRDSHAAVPGGPLHLHAGGCGGHLRVGRHLRAPRARVFRARA
jgi:hypothetical protein